jgi:hypothetical protein
MAVRPLMKARLVSLGHPLYGRFWNDQPPLHTELVTMLFRIFGPSTTGSKCPSRRELLIDRARSITLTHDSARSACLGLALTKCRSRPLCTTAI